MRLKGVRLPSLVRRRNSNTPLAHRFSSLFSFHSSLFSKTPVPARRRSWLPLSGALERRFSFCSALCFPSRFSIAVRNLRPPYMAALRLLLPHDLRLCRAAIYRGRSLVPPQRKFKCASRRTASFHSSPFSFHWAPPFLIHIFLHNFPSPLFPPRGLFRSRKKYLFSDLFHPTPADPTRTAF